MSLEELATVDVSSVTKSNESLSEAPAAIYVIAREDIVRSGATTIPEALRLAPNLQVAQTSASKYIITARGLSGNNQAQNFPNKLLVLIDGRSVYTPLFAGVYWDAQDVLLADVDRIEVLSGPGATLWGANAVNGVINIVTRKAADTHGVQATIAGGDQEQIASLRYGGSIGDALQYRAYVQGYRGGATETASGSSAGDGWNRIQGGFRADWAASATSLLTVQGDAYRAAIDQAGFPDEKVTGYNVLARWTRPTRGDGKLQIQAYYDRTERKDEAQGADFGLDIYDLEVQHEIALGSRQTLVWGAGVRFSDYAITGRGALDFSPPQRTLFLGNVFAQDSIAVTAKLKVIAGLKIEKDPYSPATLLPNLRIAWQPSSAALIWAAASRAIRSPTPLDADVRETVGATVFLRGNPDFRSEKVVAYELGTRISPSSVVSLSVSGFYNVYDDLRSIEATPGSFVPLFWGNGLGGHTYGIEAWLDVKPTDWWRLSASYGLLQERFDFDSGSSRILGVAQVANDPAHQASLRSSMNLGERVTLDGALRFVGARPDPHVPSYIELGARVGWRVSDRLDLWVSGANLLHASHLEYVAPDSNRIPRRVMVGLQWHP